MRRQEGADGDDRAPFPALVAPVPVQLRGCAVGGGIAPGLALVQVRDAARPSLPPPALLVDVFSLTATEAEVALALLGGASATTVATARGMAPSTVR